jgi:hypothetical protein
MLQWEPRVDVHDGISRTIEYVRGLLGTPRMAERVAKRTAARR